MRERERENEQEREREVEEKVERILGYEEKEENIKIHFLATSINYFYHLTIIINEWMD